MKDRDLYDTVMANAFERNSHCGSMEAQHYNFAVFRRYEECCAARDVSSLPVTKESATAFLLMRAAEGATDAELSVDMRVVENFHLLCPNKAYGSVRQQAFRDFSRALGFAKQIMRDGVTIFDLPKAIRVKAFEMFPDGEIPARFEDVAA